MRFSILIAAAALLICALPARAQQVGDAALLGALNSPLVESTADAAAIRNFYAQRGNALYWMDSADSLVEAIGVSWAQGLNPAQYHLEQIQNLREAFKEHPDDAKLAQLDILLTDAFARYGRDLSGPRINLADLGLDPANWKKPAEISAVLDLLAQNKDPARVLGSLAPHSHTYQLLQEELVRLAAQPAEAYTKILPITLDGSLQPGQRSQKVPDLRLRLNVPQQTDDPYLYDDRLAAAMIRFQYQSKLQGDGVIGPATLKLLNQNTAQKIRQVVANLERLRWVEEARPARFVMVNVPAATLWSIEDSHVAFEMPVIVGKPDRPTQSFITNIIGVRFNPDWTVPQRIKREDILPKLQDNPDYLADKGMELVRRGKDGKTETVDPDSIDWKTAGASDLARLEMVQTPGSNNPLGRIRLLMPNKFDIYLHDTNQPEYFDKNQRAQSSGCIRMSEPEKMAEFVMAREKSWNKKRLAAVLKDGKTRDFRITDPIKVYILYYTVWADGFGKINYGNDIYNLDESLLQMLGKIDGLSVPGHNG